MHNPNTKRPAYPAHAGLFPSRPVTAAWTQTFPLPAQLPPLFPVPALGLPSPVPTRLNLPPPAAARAFAVCSPMSTIFPAPPARWPLYPCTSWTMLSPREIRFAPPAPFLAGGPAWPTPTPAVHSTSETLPEGLFITLHAKLPISPVHSEVSASRLAGHCNGKEQPCHKHAKTHPPTHPRMKSASVEFVPPSGETTPRTGRASTPRLSAAIVTERNGKAPTHSGAMTSSL